MIVFSAPPYFQANNKSIGLYKTETEIRWRKDDNKLKKRTDINRHGPKLCIFEHQPAFRPPHFSLVTTSKDFAKHILYNPMEEALFFLLTSGWPLKKTLFSDFVHPRHWTILLFMRRCFPAWIVLHLWRGPGTFRAGVWKQTRPRRRSFIQET